MIGSIAREADDFEVAAGTLSRLEADLLTGAGVDVGIVGDLVEVVRRTADDGLVGRALCLLSAAQSSQGEHELALGTAHEAIRGFAHLDTATAGRYAGLHAELFRIAGAALAKLGRVAQALPLLQQAVQLAQAGLDQAGLDVPLPDHPVAAPPAGTVITAPTALVRCLITLGTALEAIREIDAAIDVYYRALRVTRAHPAALEDVLVDTVLVRSALAGALHERIERARAAGHREPAVRDIAAAGRLLDADASSIESGKLGTRGRAAHYAALGRHLLLTAQPAEARAAFERQLGEFRSVSDAQTWGLAGAHAGLAQALLALDEPRAALDQSVLAGAQLDRHDDPRVGAAVLMVAAAAQRALGEHAAAYDALEKYHALRAGLETAAAEQNAAHMTAQLGLERAGADAESHRRVAAMLEALGQIGQEITANLDAVAVFQIFTRHVESLLRVSAFTVWLLDAGGGRLMLAFGIDNGVAISAADILIDDPRSPAALAVRERHEIFCGPDAHRQQTKLFEPLLVADRILGVVSIESDQPDAFSEQERSIFRTICTYAAIALDNATAYSKLEQTVFALQEAQAELARQTAEFERLSLTDSLTGVANRRQLHERAQVEISAMQRKASPLSVAIFDIDHFKRVNDTHGHAAGDAVLQKIAGLAKEWLRPGDLIARIGGEEFALLLPGVGIHGAVAIAERIRSSIAETTVVIETAKIHVTSSFGVAAFDAACDTLEHALSRADRALYAAKIAGRDRVLATPSVCV